MREPQGGRKQEHVDDFVGRLSYALLASEHSLYGAGLLPER
jgi:hypothetical protein